MFPKSKGVFFFWVTQRRWMMCIWSRGSCHEGGADEEHEEDGLER